MNTLFTPSPKGTGVSIYLSYSKLLMDVTDPNQGFGKFYYPTGATYGICILYLYLPCLCFEILIV